MLNRIALFQGLSQQQITLLERSAVRRHVPKNTVVFLKGDLSDSLYIIQRGSAKAVRQDDNGRQIILNRFGPHEYFGEMSFLDGQPRCATVITREACDVLVIPRSAFLKLADMNAGIYKNMTRFLLNKLRAATQLIEDLAISDVYGRLARVLCDYQDPEGLLTESFTQQELAEMVGASRETVCRLINDLSADGYLAKKGSLLVIKKRLPYKYK